MLPDLRFVIGAVMATTLLGVTLFGLTAAMHISHQSKVGPLEASRMLAYTPDGRHRIFDITPPRFDSPFANIPAAPSLAPVQRPAEPAEPPVQAAAAMQPVAVAEQAATTAEPASLTPSTGDPDTVDERAVVDPPLPADDDPPATEAAPSAPESEPAAAAVPPLEIAPVETVPAILSPAEVPPFSETPAPPAAAVETPAAMPDVPQVGSIPAATEDAETDAQDTKTKRKRKAAKAKRPAQSPRPQSPAQFDVFGSSSYPLTTTTTVNRPARGFWTFE